MNCIKLGIKVFIGHSKKKFKKFKNISKIFVIKNNNNEIKFAKIKKYTIYSRAGSFSRRCFFKKYNCYRFTRQNNNYFFNWEDFV